jgi:signal transduction histidine kinase
MAHYSAKLEEARAIFLGVLAHDLRGPLNTVGISAQVILHCQPLDPRATQAAARAWNSVSRMKVLVQDLLDYTLTRLGDGMPVTPREDVLELTVKDVVAEVEAAHPGRRIDFVSSCQTHGQWDTGRIAQMFSNLLTNAIVHGHPDAPVTIGIAEANEGVNIEIRNKGEPIPAEVRSAIFEPLTSTRRAASTASSTSGLGLGLYIAAQIATAHHGHLQLVPSDEVETVFRVYLPRAPRATPGRDADPGPPE